MRQILFDHSSIDDVLQDTFARLLQKNKSFANEKEAFRYLRRAVLNTAIDYYRRLNRQNALTKFSSLNPEETSNPLTTLIRREDEQRQNLLLLEIKKALKTLPPKQKEAIDLIFSRNGQKLQEICEEKRIPYFTLRSRMLSAVDHIRKQLKTKGLYQDGREVKRP